MRYSFPFYKQHDIMDCGPTCLRMIAKYYGKHFNLEYLRFKANYSREGVSLLGISNAAETIGLKTLAVQINFEQLLTKAPLPCIVHWNQNHFVVVTPQSRKNKVVIADPSLGIITYKKNEFIKKWVNNQGSEEKGVALLLETTNDFFEQAEDIKEERKWSFLFSYLKKYKTLIHQLVLTFFIGSLLQLIFPFLTQNIIDVGINTHNLTFIHIMLAGQFMLFFSRTVIEFIRSRIMLHISTRINLSILSEFWIKLMKLSMSFFDTKRSGDIMQRINDHRRIESFITTVSLQTLFSVLNLAVFSLVLLYYSFSIFSLFAIGSLLYLLWIRFFLRARKSLDHKKFDAASRESSATMQLIFGMQEIKLNNAEKQKRWEWERIQAELFSLNFKSLSLTQYQQAGAFFINEGKNILITYLVATAVLDGRLTVGAMLAIQYIIGQLNGPVEQLISFSQFAQDAKLSLERLNEIHQCSDEEPQQARFLEKIPEDHAIRLSNVSFTYPGADNQPVLKNLNLSIPAYKTTAIVGLSGSGKTTILKLLLKFYEQYSGEIKIGGSTFKHIRPSYWRSVCGCVMQDGYIFSDSIEKNITVGDLNPDFERLAKACKMANITSFIESLPMGFNTKIGAEGNGISQGQKQRILIARAIYKEPEFIFFDEATNALDANNESTIIENLQKFFEGRTVVVVAHRLSTVKNADKIVVVDNGSVIEEGTHQELTHIKGTYYELVKNQLELGV